MAVLINIIKHKDGNVVSLCEDGLLGKVYKDEKCCLDLARYRKFYEGKDSEGIGNLKEELDSASSINAVGEQSLKLLEKYGFDVSGAKTIGNENVRHIQIYRF